MVHIPGEDSDMEHDFNFVGHLVLKEQSRLLKGAGDSKKSEAGAIQSRPKRSM